MQARSPTGRPITEYRQPRATLDPPEQIENENDDDDENDGDEGQQ
jgi:hypothetical protein